MSDWIAVKDHKDKNNKERVLAGEKHGSLSVMTIVIQYIWRPPVWGTVKEGIIFFRE